MVAYMRVVKKMARENGCWKEEKSKWTQAHIRDMIGAIINAFMKRFMDRTNRARDTSWSTIYDRMSNLSRSTE